jgi:hypothetical protein
MAVPAAEINSSEHAPLPCAPLPLSGTCAAAAQYIFDASARLSRQVSSRRSSLRRFVRVRAAGRGSGAHIQIRFRQQTCAGGCAGAEAHRDLGVR